MNKPTEKYLDTKWGKQVALHEGDVDVNTPLMSMVLDEENITLDSNQNIEITANEVLNVGRSEFTYTDSNGAIQTKIEETQSITIDTEELCTVGVTSFGTVIELDEDNFMMPLNRVKMEGSVKDGFADMGSPGQSAGEEAEQVEEVVEAVLEVVEDVEAEIPDEIEEESKKPLWKRVGKGILKVGIGIALGAVAVLAAPAIIGAAAAATSFLAFTAIASFGTAFFATSMVYGSGLFSEGVSDVELAIKGDVTTPAVNALKKY